MGPQSRERTASLFSKALDVSKIEVTPKGQGAKYSIELVRVNTDWAKLWLHERIRWPQDQRGAFFISEDTTDAYCMEMVSEARVAKSSGKATWVARSRENHALDAECLAYIAGYLLNAQRIPEGYRRPVSRQSAPPTPPPAAPRRENWLGGDDWLGNNSGWFNR